MFAAYAYFNGVQATVQTNILADLQLILTGTTSVSILSSTCDKNNTTITADVPAGWSLSDTSAGTNAKCIRAPLVDDSATYKYVVLDTNTNGTLFAKAYESWNTSTHVGTNLVYNSDSSYTSQRFDTTQPGMIYIFATQRYIVLYGKSANTIWGSVSNLGATVIAERSRMWADDTVQNGMPPWCHFDTGGVQNSTSYNAFTPRRWNHNFNILSGADAMLDMHMGPWGTLMGGLMSGVQTGMLAKGKSISGSADTLPIFEILLSRNAHSLNPYGSISAVSGIYMIPGGILGPLDTTTYGGITYSCVKGYNDKVAFLVRKG